MTQKSAFNLVSIAAALALAGSLAACGPGGMSKETGGTLAGAVVGGVVGNQFGKGGGRVAATAVGAVLGGIIGSSIGRSLDEMDRRAAAEAEYNALEYGQSGVATSWRNPDSGRYGRVTPGRPYERSGVNCREYEHTVFIDGRPETMRGTACRQPDGTWRQQS